MDITLTNLLDFLLSQSQNITKTLEGSKNNEKPKFIRFLGMCYSKSRENYDFIYKGKNLLEKAKIIDILYILLIHLF